tara:strand:+ start:25051 stop:26085 length:1035 start_codon:yes stop_codon:yes gene_type:complete
MIKSNWVSAMIALSSLSVLGAPGKSSIPNGSTEYRQTTTSKSNETTPTAFYVSKSPYDLVLRSNFLAPSEGTEIAFGLSAAKIKISNRQTYGSVKSDSDYTIGTFSAAHALSDAIFIGTTVNHTQAKIRSHWVSNDTPDYTSDNSSSINGVSDPLITVGGRIRTVPVTILLALSAKVSTGVNESKDISDSDSESDAKDGGSSLIPTLSVYNNNSNLVAGGTISYSFRSERTYKFTNTDGVKSESKSTGGNIQNASLFTEINVTKASLGGSIDYTKIERSTSKSNGYEYENSGLSFTTLTAYSKVNLSEGFSLIPSLSIGQFGEGTGNYGDKLFYTGSVIGKASF